MKKLIHFLSMSLIFLLISCSQSATEEKESSDASLTVEPKELSDVEKNLVSKTDVGMIEYFLLNGKLKEGEDLEISIEVYRNGSLETELMKTYGQIDPNLKNELISFAVRTTGDEQQFLQLIAGHTSGVSSTYQPNEVSMSSLSRLVDGKVQLELNKPLYIAMWAGTSGNTMSTGGSEDGSLPEGLDEVEVAYLYKVTLIH
jgi:hypothetical protein